MTYAFIENSQIIEYPVYEGDIRLRHPNVSFASPFAPPEGYEAVTDIAPPAYDYRSNVSEGEPVRVDGTLTRNWVVTAASAEEIAEREARQWASVRADRNARLAACDWTQLADAPVNAADWTDYRQALRDVTTQTDPFNIVWPAAPGA